MDINGRYERSRSPSRFCFGENDPCWSNESLRSNLSLCNMLSIGCGSSKHTLADRECTLSLEETKKNLMSRNFPANQNEVMAQQHISGFRPST